jgi:hypothetical protein
MQGPQRLDAGTHRRLIRARLEPFTWTTGLAMSSEVWRRRDLAACDGREVPIVTEQSWPVLATVGEGWALLVNGQCGWLVSGRLPRGRGAIA